MKDLTFPFHRQLSSLFNLVTLPGNAPSHLPKFKNLYLTMGILVRKLVFCSNFIPQSNFFWTTFYTRQYLPLRNFTPFTASCDSVAVKVPRILRKCSNLNHSAFVHMEYVLFTIMIKSPVKSPSSCKSL